MSLPSLRRDASWRRALTMAFAALAIGVAIVAVSLGRPSSVIAGAAHESCPSASALERLSNPRAAIPAAKAAFGSPGRVLEVKRGPSSTYAATAKRECGADVLRDSIYVVVHPIGMVCAACNLHAYVVKFVGGPWHVWTAY